MPGKSAIPSPTRTASTASSDLSLQSAMSSDSIQYSQGRVPVGKVVIVPTTVNGVMLRTPQRVKASTPVKGAGADTTGAVGTTGNTKGVGLSSAQYGGGRRKMLDIINRLHNTG